MSTDLARIYIEATDNTHSAFDSFKRNVADAGIGISRIQGLLGSLGISASVGGFVLLAKSAIQAAIEVQQSGKRLEAVLQATGHSAGIAQSEIQKMAESLSRSTGFNNQAIEAGAASFLKLGNIQQDVFRQGMKYAADYAAFAGRDFQGAAQLIGRALQSPEHGLKALQREFGQLSPAQTAAIKQFIELNDLAGAQGVILEILRTKIGGTAEAMHTGLKGALDDITNSWRELLETAGKTPHGGGVLKWINDELRITKELVESGSWKELLSYSHFLHNAMPKPGFAKGKIGVSGGSLDDAAAQARANAGLAEEQRIGDIHAAEGLKFIKEENEKRLALEKEVDKLILDQWEKTAHEKQRIREESNKKMVALTQELSDLDEKARVEDIRSLEDYLEQLQEITFETKKVNDFARDMGLTFSSAFEDAIVAGLGLSDVLQGLYRDMLRIIARKTVTEPLGDAVSSLLSSALAGFGGAFSGGGGSTAPGMSQASIASVFGPRAEGGSVYAGQSYLVGERGPELFMPSSQGTIIPNSGMGETHLHYSPVYHIDSRTDQATIIAEIEAGNRRTEARLYDNLRRGGAFAKAVGRA